MASFSSSSFFAIEPLECAETCRCALDACSLCGKRLAGDRDIFMYRFVVCLWRLAVCLLQVFRRNADFVC